MYKHGAPCGRTPKYSFYRAVERFPCWFRSPADVEELAQTNPQQLSELLAYLKIREGEEAEANFGARI